MGLFINLLISSIGLAYFVYGKKGENFFFLMLGLILMVYPYFVPNLILSTFIGVILIISPLIVKKIFQ